MELGFGLVEATVAGAPLDLALAAAPLPLGSVVPLPLGGYAICTYGVLCLSTGGNSGNSCPGSSTPPLAGGGVLTVAA